MPHARKPSVNSATSAPSSALDSRLDKKRKSADASAITGTDLLHDVRYTFRTLRRDPGFACISLLILALAIGANVAVFSVVNTIFLRPLPFPHRTNWSDRPSSVLMRLVCATYSADAYEEFSHQSRAYQGVTGYEAFTILKISG